MKRYSSLNIVTNSNGIVRIYGNGGMVFEVQCDYVKVETMVDCGSAPASGTVPKLKDPIMPKINESWVIGSFFGYQAPDGFGIFECVSRDLSKGFLMLGVTDGVRNTEHYASELDIARSHQIAHDMGDHWETKAWPHIQKIKIPKDSIAQGKNLGRIMLDEDDFTPMSAEEKWRRDNWDLQPESKYFKS